ncbi:hypothetical protein N5B55_05825 [Ralstonia pickettii]|uniref:hypothetical protein n=1 Tax=Ralstonia pickettii TaxID=329 RepID=UPI002714A580|nr:hypothetical protein [Ralstonia pickettii]WKZ86468.1 hypothetical protein N5B55_05825 [Ralstonia pickettii]
MKFEEHRKAIIIALLILLLALLGAGLWYEQQIATRNNIFLACHARAADAADAARQLDPRVGEKPRAREALTAYNEIRCMREHGYHLRIAEPSCRPELRPQCFTVLSGR